MDVNVSVPTYLVTDNDEIVNTYVKANSATKTEDGYYVNPESHYEVVAVNKDTGLDAVSATKDAWEKVLKKFGRIGNYSDVYKETATWYSRPLISGNKEADQARKYQYFDSVDAIDNIDRYVNTQDLDNDGIDSLWYEYIPEQSKDAKEGMFLQLFYSMEIQMIQEHNMIHLVGHKLLVKKALFLFVLNGKDTLIKDIHMIQ